MFHLPFTYTKLQSSYCHNNLVCFSALIHLASGGSKLHRAAQTLRILSAMGSIEEGSSLVEF